jgi:hypothetical protein
MFDLERMKELSDELIKSFELTDSPFPEGHIMNNNKHHQN